MRVEHREFSRCEKTPGWMRYKPSSVPPALRVTMLKAKTIYLDLSLLIGSPDGKRPTRDSNGLNKTSSLLDLTPGGVYHAANFTIRAVRSYRTISPLPLAAL